MAKYTEAEVTVIGLVGERGREVQEVLEDDLGEDGLARSVVIVATGDEPALMRRPAYLTLSVAEYFRGQTSFVFDGFCNPFCDGAAGNWFVCRRASNDQGVSANNLWRIGASIGTGGARYSWGRGYYWPVHCFVEGTIIMSLYPMRCGDCWWSHCHGAWHCWSGALSGDQCFKICVAVFAACFYRAAKWHLSQVQTRLFLLWEYGWTHPVRGVP